jgi:hypothetical protein
VGLPLDLALQARGAEEGLPLGIAGWSSGGFFALALSQHPPEATPLWSHFSHDHDLESPAIGLGAEGTGKVPLFQPSPNPHVLRRRFPYYVQTSPSVDGFSVAVSKGSAEWMLKTQTGYWHSQEAPSPTTLQWMGPRGC